MKLKIIIYSFCCFLWILIPLIGAAQVKQVPTGTHADLYDLSVLKKDIFVSGIYDYLIKSNDECDNLIPLVVPGPTGNITLLRIVDTTKLFLLSFNSSQTLLFRSNDKGANWVQKSSIGGALSHNIAFFDSTEAMMTDGPFLWRTTDGGGTWANANFSNTPLSIAKTSIKTFGDSMVCMGGANVTGQGFALSKDRGNTWPYGWGVFGHDIEMTDYFFLNRDTLFAVSIGGVFVSTIDGGINWKSVQLPLKDAYGIRFINSKQGYVVGVDALGFGAIARTTDLGKTWSMYTTEFTTNLISIDFLNDSLALLAGTKGILLKWNFKSSVFTGLGEDYLYKMNVTAFPNPTSAVLNFSSDATLSGSCKVTFTSAMGQNVYIQENFNLNDALNIGFLKSGMYYVKLEDHNTAVVFKLVKD